MVRDGADGLQTWMMRRVRAMAFAPGAAVFPGGRVDPRDADVSVPWSGPGPDAAAARMGTDAATARALVTAALADGSFRLVAAGAEFLFPPSAGQP
jgi:8-oxo-dGTP pyrophosphatase MutT (NUDIX family)